MMRWPVWLLGIAALSASTGSAAAQMLLSGRVWAPRSPLARASLPAGTGVIEDYFGAAGPLPSEEVAGLANVRCFASRVGSDAESLAFMTWSTQPTGWYRFTGAAGNYALLFTGLDVPPRPTLVTNVYLSGSDRLDLKIVPPFDYCVLNERAYDTKAAQKYFQTFVARGRSITHVSFRLVHDGVDGIGPGSQAALVSIHHKQGTGSPETWPQVGPTALVPNVDAGGPKNPDFLAAWNSGEVPVTPGEMYAVHLRPQAPDGTFQAFWRPDEKDEIPGDCYRIGQAGTTGWQHCDLSMSIAADGDGLLIPYNKRIQPQYGTFAGFARRWSQTYVARGRGLAGVVLYAATGGSQPGIQRQRVRFRVREGGPDGPPVGIEKIGIGTGIYTGDAAWGTFGAVFSPGEVNLVPGRTYAIEAESIENYESLHGYVNIKGVVSDEKPGFNPYRKMAPDTCESGTAYKHGTEAVDFDLDMQIIEYEYAAREWAQAVIEKNLLGNGDMESGELDPQKSAEGTPHGWKRFEISPGSTAGSQPGSGRHLYVTEGPAHTNRILRVATDKGRPSPLDAGYVQRIDNVSRTQTYRWRGRVRCSFPLDDEHACMIGVDPTGQTNDPQASTIQWTRTPPVHSIWTTHVGDPVRPTGSVISIWLRAATQAKNETTFKADFDDFSLQQVRCDVPGPADESNVSSR